MRKRMRFLKRMRVAMVCAATSSVLGIGSCIDVDSDVFTVFREAYVPGLVQGLTTAVTSPDQADAAFRQTVVAFIEGIGAVWQPENSTTPIRSSSLDN